MRFFKGYFESEYSQDKNTFGIHVLDEDTEFLYTYVQDFKAWHRNTRATDHFHFPELHEGQGQVTFEEVSRDTVYELLPQIRKFDRREEPQRKLWNKFEAQFRRSGQVLTSAEVGLLTKPLGQRPAAAPQIKELLETRSQHRRWTALMLYEEDGATRRKAISTLRANTRLQISSKGNILEVQHRTKKYTIDGQDQRLIVVEAKYVPAADQGLTPEGGNDDE